MDEAREKLPLRFWLAVWRWPRWVWAVMGLVAGFVYLVSPEPVAVLMQESGFSVFAPTANSLIIESTKPAIWIGEKIPFLGTIHKWQFDAYRGRSNREKWERMIEHTNRELARRYLEEAPADATMPEN
jgi:hypothetical protein